MAPPRQHAAGLAYHPRTSLATMRTRAQRSATRTSVLRNARIDLEAPAVDAADEIRDVKSRRPEIPRGRGAALSAVAVHDDVARAVERRHLMRQLRHGNQSRALDVCDLPLVWFADVDELERMTIAILTQ